MLMALVGAGMVAAGPVLVYEGVHGQSMITDELTAQKITFPADRAQLPDALKEYAGQQVTTGSDAKAYADLIMGETLRGSLMSAYQAERVTWLAIGLGGLLIALGATAGVAAYSMYPRKIVVPASPEALVSGHLPVG
ncbi:hypothetical protein [Krasilnikovia sp. MM14-A1259]|uniref:hypothetical protein n=1 Tax=Krasilnikovia sp. MM14-A1259 TaxID=3373539 RepID=UPI003810628A